MGGFRDHPAQTPAEDERFSCGARFLSLRRAAVEGWLPSYPERTMEPTLPGVDDYPLPTLQEYIRQRPRPDVVGAGLGPATPYAHPVDQRLIRLLSRTSLQHATNRFLELAIDFFFTRIWQNSIPVASRSFPELNRIRAQAAETLGIAVPEIYVAAGERLGTVGTVGTDEQHFIFVDSTWLSLAPADEVLFVIGHESGHIHNQHVTYRTLAFLLLEGGASLLDRHPLLGLWAKMLRLLFEPVLAAWSRRAEVTGDRAGLLCGQDLRSAERALVRLMLGFARDTEVDIDAYLDDMRERPPTGLSARLGLLNATHPPIPRRLEALRLFHDSELYYDCLGHLHPERPLLSAAELNDRVDDLIAVL
ncbi:MAG: M48 family metallopeptidase [Armatimonadetes bacterium]|nr:M48 family metallopeptidase [Armatimonadota bacterium]